MGHEFKISCQSLYGSPDKMKCGKRQTGNRSITLHNCANCDRPEKTMVKVEEKKDDKQT